MVRKLLEKDAAVLNREFFGVLDDATTEAPTTELTALGRFPNIPIKVFAEIRTTTPNSRPQCALLGRSAIRS